jgi:hypothetical protein
VTTVCLIAKEDRLEKVARTIDPVRAVAEFWGRLATTPKVRFRLKTGLSDAVHRTAPDPFQTWHLECSRYPRLLREAGRRRTRA